MTTLPIIILSRHRLVTVLASWLFRLDAFVWIQGHPGPGL